MLTTILNGSPVEPGKVKGGRLEFLVPHLLRGQLLRPGFVRLSLRLGVAQQMPYWAKLQFINSGVDPRDLDEVLGRITSLTSWVREWERLGHAHEEAGKHAIARGNRADAARHLLAASAAYNFAQYVVFMDIDSKRRLHDSCVRSYADAAPYFDPPAVRFDVSFRRRAMEGFLRIPPGRRPAPVVVIFNGTNAVKEELHWWSDALLGRGIATIVFDGPGLGTTWHRLTSVLEPGPAGRLILDAIDAHPALDPRAVGFLGMSLGGYLAIRMAARESRVRAVGAVSPPFSTDIYWDVTLAGLRRELAALYGVDETEMGRAVHRITLAGVIQSLRAPMLLAGGGQDHITPSSEARRIYEEARCARELLYYPRGAHDCFNVLADLRPRMASWFAGHLDVQVASRADEYAWSDSVWPAAEAVDPDFADDLAGDAPRRIWNQAEEPAVPVRWEWPWTRRARVEIVRRTARAGEAAIVPELEAGVR